MLDSDQGPLVVSAGLDRALRSWRLDGQPGPLSVADAHADRIEALAAVHTEQGPVIISVGDDRTIMATSLDFTVIA